MKLSDEPKLPDGAVEVAGWADLSPAWATMERGKDGAVYFVTWWYGTPTVKCVVYADGTTWMRDD